MMLKLRTNGFGYACGFYFNHYKGLTMQILFYALKVPHATSNSNNVTGSVHHCLSVYTKATEQQTTRVPFVRDARARCRELLQSSGGLIGEEPVTQPKLAQIRPQNQDKFGLAQKPISA